MPIARSHVARVGACPDTTIVASAIATWRPPVASGVTSPAFRTPARPRHVTLTLVFFLFPDRVFRVDISNRLLRTTTPSLHLLIVLPFIT
ncbi:hypothetical protein ACLOJK_009649 [Asimina triloba]